MDGVRGVDLDPQTRCAHYRSVLDIVAIRMACCETYYACKDCHGELADHALETWSRDRWGDKAILCGACKHELTILQYMDGGSRCQECGAPFNPGCRNHYHFYFEAEPAP